MVTDGEDLDDDDDDDSQNLDDHKMSSSAPLPIITIS